MLQGVGGPPYKVPSASNSISGKLPYLTQMKCIFFAALAVLISLPVFTQKQISEDEVQRLYQRAVAQYTYMMQRLPKGRFPKTYHAAEDRFETSDSGWWVSGFYPGTLVYLYEETRSPGMRKEALRVMADLEKEQFNTGTHDLGFMMFNSFGQINRLEPDSKWDSILVNSARSLSTRFNPQVGCIRSWNASGDDFLVIIDNMMNLELLLWASRKTGDPFFEGIAHTHAKTTMANHFRPDYSSYHVLNYDPASGAIRQRRTAQGFSDASAWSRGQVWGLYGYTMMFRETRQPEYLEQATRIAEFLLSHPNMPADGIPYWDMDATDIPETYRDASAGAILAAALLELSTFVDAAHGGRYFKAAENVLLTLMSPQYLAKSGSNGGFLLKHGVGHLPQGSEVDVPLAYGDYYFMEALYRYRRL